MTKYGLRSIPCQATPPRIEQLAHEIGVPNLRGWRKLRQYVSECLRTNFSVFSIFLVIFRILKIFSDFSTFLGRKWQKITKNGKKIPDFHFFSSKKCAEKLNSGKIRPKI